MIYIFLKFSSGIISNYISNNPVLIKSIIKLIWEKKKVYILFSEQIYDPRLFHWRTEMLTEFVPKWQVTAWNRRQKEEKEEKVKLKTKLWKKPMSRGPLIDCTDVDIYSFCLFSCLNAFSPTSLRGGGGGWGGI